MSVLYSTYSNKYFLNSLSFVESGNLNMHILKFNQRLVYSENRKLP